MRKMPLHTSTVMKAGMHAKTKGGATQGGAIASGKRRTRSAASGQTAGVMGAYGATHKGPMNAFGSKSRRG